MAISIICYSNTGNNRVLAGHLADRLQCGVAHVAERRRRSWLTTARDLAFGWSPGIEPLHASLDAYRHIILVGPVWASRLASPLRTFLHEHGHELGEYSFITLCGYARPEQQQRLTRELTRRVGHAPRAVCQLPVSDLVPRLQRNDVRVVTPYRISDDDMIEYEERITSFLEEAGARPTAAGEATATPSERAGPSASQPRTRRELEPVRSDRQT